ncbi:hypothetical protein V8C86DRAFT_3026728 [Haematococcus lacustris]
MPADSWGSVATQCVIPGAAFPSFPWTAPLSSVCDNTVITLDLVDLTPPPAQGVSDFSYNKVGILYIFKDYSDVLYFTVSLNATWAPNRGGPTDPVSPALPFNAFFVGQYLHAQPHAGFTGVGRGPTVGSVLVWDALDLGLISSQAPPYTNLLNPDAYGGFDSRLWSCFTYRIDLKAVCNPSLAEFRTVDFSNPGQLAFTVTKFSLTPGCSPSAYAPSQPVPGGLAPSGYLNPAAGNVNTSALATGLSRVSSACGCADLNTVSPTVFANSPSGTLRAPAYVAALAAAGVPNLAHVNQDPGSNGYWPASTITIGTPATYSAWYFSVAGTLLTPSHCAAIDTFIAPFLVGRSQQPAQYCTLYSNQDPLTGILRVSILLKAVSFGLAADRDLMFAVFAQTSVGVAPGAAPNTLQNNWAGLLRQMGIDRAGPSPACNLLAIYFQGDPGGNNPGAGSMLATGFTSPSGLPPVLILGHPEAPGRPPPPSPPPAPPPPPMPACAVSVTITRTSTTALGGDLDNLLSTLNTLFTRVFTPYPYAILPGQLFVPFPPNTNTTYTAVLALTNATQLPPWYSFVTSSRQDLMAVLSATRVPPLACADTLTFSDLCSSNVVYTYSGGSVVSVQVDLDPVLYDLMDISQLLNLQAISAAVFALYRLRGVEQFVDGPFGSDARSITTDLHVPNDQSGFGSLTQVPTTSLPAITALVNGMDELATFFVRAAALPCGAVVTPQSLPPPPTNTPPSPAPPTPPARRYEFFIETPIAPFPALRSVNNQDGTVRIVVDRLCSRLRDEMNTALQALQPPPLFGAAYLMPNGVRFKNCSAVVVTPAKPNTGVKVFQKLFLNITQQQFRGLVSASSYIRSDAFVQRTNTFCGSRYVFRASDGATLVAFNPTSLSGLGTNGVCATTLPSA